VKRSPMPKRRKHMKRGKKRLKSTTSLRSISKSARRAQELAADDLWRDCIRKRDKWTCQYCGKVNRDVLNSGKLVVVQAHHIITRASKQVRHSMENGILLCSGCHKFQAHGNPENFRDFLIEKWMGQERFDALKLRSNIKAGKYDAAMECIQLGALLAELRGR